MKKIFEKTINVNELDDILRKHFKAADVFITKVAVGTIKNQFSPRSFDVGAGACLDITFEISRKRK